MVGYDSEYRRTGLSIIGKVCLLLFLLLALVLWSPVFPGVFGLPAAYMYLSIILLLAGLIVLEKGVRQLELMVVLFLVCSVLFFALITQSGTNFNRFIFLPIVLYVCFKLAKDRAFIERFSFWYTIFALLSIALAWASFIYVLAGGEPQLEFKNPDGRPNSLYLTSFSNAVVGGIIRPAFIYDEPGAFSFVLVTAVVVREMLSKGRLISVLILLGGLVTLSLTHVMVLALYVFLVLSLRLKVLSILFLVLTILLTIDDPRFGFFYDRFKSDSDNSGLSNRTVQLKNFYDVIVDDPSVIFFGDYKCHDREEKRCMEHGDISSSPVTPLYLGGVFLFAVQLITHIALVVILFNRRFFFPAAAISLLLLQRPYFSSLGYQLIVYGPLFFMINDLRFNRQGGL